MCKRILQYSLYTMKALIFTMHRPYTLCGACADPRDVYLGSIVTIFTIQSTISNHELFNLKN